MNLWLDDIRPAPDGWIWVTSIEMAKPHLLSGSVEQCSLDHDLGACTACYPIQDDGTEWLMAFEMQSMPHCPHIGTGYTLLCWMEENDIWPKHRPIVHSANPVGKKRMQQVIDKKFGPNWNGL